MIWSATRPRSRPSSARKAIPDEIIAKPIGRPIARQPEEQDEHRDEREAHPSSSGQSRPSRRQSLRPERRITITTNSTKQAKARLNGICRIQVPLPAHEAHVVEGAGQRDQEGQRAEPALWAIASDPPCGGRGGVVEHVEGDVLALAQDEGRGEEHHPDVGERRELERPARRAVEHVAGDDLDHEGAEHGREHRGRGQLGASLQPPGQALGARHPARLRRAGSWRLGRVDPVEQPGRPVLGELGLEVHLLHALRGTPRRRAW